MPELPSLPFAFGNQVEVDDTGAPADEPKPGCQGPQRRQAFEVKELRLVRPNRQNAARERAEGRPLEVASPGPPDIRSYSPTTLSERRPVSPTLATAQSPYRSAPTLVQLTALQAAPIRLVVSAQSVSERSDPWRQPPRPSRMVSVVLLLAWRDHPPGQL